MLVTRHRLDEYPHNAGPIPRASARLLAANNAEFANNPCFDYGHCVVIFPLPEEEREAAVELLKRAVAEKVARLRELRATMPDPAELRAAPWRRRIATVRRRGSCGIATRWRSIGRCGRRFSS